MAKISADANDNDVASETVVAEVAPERRKLFRRLAALAGLGITGVLLSQEKTGLLPEASAAAVTTGIVNTPGMVAVWDAAADITSYLGLLSWDGTGSLGLQSTATTRGVSAQVSSTIGSSVYGQATATTGTPIGVLGLTENVQSFTRGMAGVQGIANTGTGVLGQTTSGTGVEER